MLLVNEVRKYDYYNARIIKMKAIEIQFDPIFVYAMKKYLESVGMVK
jgi:hypothetical protein